MAYMVNMLPECSYLQLCQVWQRSQRFGHLTQLVILQFPVNKPVQMIYNNQLISYTRSKLPSTSQFIYDKECKAMVTYSICKEASPSNAVSWISAIRFSYSILKADTIDTKTTRTQ